MRRGWCDALFMSSPVWAKLSAVTGDPTYLEFRNQEWWTAMDYLYDGTMSPSTCIIAIIDSSIHWSPMASRISSAVEMAGYLAVCRLFCGICQPIILIGANTRPSSRKWQRSIWKSKGTTGSGAPVCWMRKRIWSRSRRRGKALPPASIRTACWDSSTPSDRLLVKLITARPKCT